MSGAATKPLDVGSGRVCASFDASSAAWLSLGAAHPIHGFVELAAVPDFPATDRGDPAATRRHRLLLTLDEHAFLLIQVDGARPHLRADPSDPVAPRWEGDRLAVRAWTGAGSPAVHQAWTFEGNGARRPTVVVRLQGGIDRPALAEITELEPPRPTGAVTSPLASGQTVTLEAAGLPATAEIVATGADVAWAGSNDGLIGTVAWPPDAVWPLRLELTCRLGMVAGPDHATGQSGSWTAAGSDPFPADPLIDRSLAYVRGCAALLTDRPDERAILADHRILPLSWTRDAYWQALALLAADGIGDRARVADHLRWLWRRCERPDGRWVRSHHANGRRKDLAFQADQQLYPMIELADFWRVTQTLPRGVDWAIEVGRAWGAAVSEVDPVTGLMASAENAADDPADVPFIAASQILLWYTAERIAEMADAGALEVDGAALREIGASVRTAFDARVAAVDGPWAYAVDADGRRVDYHDANDLPVALAPLLGFCGADDPGWRATMDFAFSPRNPAWFDGPRPGLGSLHTRQPWPLGDVQAWIVGRLTGNQAASARALEELRIAAYADGMLPEARPTGEEDTRIRHWFAWPGAALAALRILDEAGRLEERLSIPRIA